jgi:hypothetical protein
VSLFVGRVSILLLGLYCTGFFLDSRISSYSFIAVIFFLLLFIKTKKNNDKTNDNTKRHTLIINNLIIIINQLIITAKNNDARNSNTKENTYRHTSCDRTTNRLRVGCRIGVGWEQDRKPVAIVSTTTFKVLSHSLLRQSSDCMIGVGSEECMTGVSRPLEGVSFFDNKSCQINCFEKCSFKI